MIKFGYVSVVTAQSEGSLNLDSKGVELLLQVVVWCDIGVEFELCR